MKTTSEEYKDYLENKYLLGREKYLRWIFYPKIARQFNNKPIVDLGCGTGEFVKYLKLIGHECKGTDNNPHLVDKCVKMGFDVVMDDLTKLEIIQPPVYNAIVDNVLEHLDLIQINSFFKNIKAKISPGGTLVVVVPYIRGYSYDPTHKTFVDRDIITKFCNNYGLKLERFFFHPFNVELVGRFLYLNMQVFTIRF